MTFVNTKTPVSEETVTLTGRALAKQRTREKILEAGRQLFMERGYEGATVRDIAKAAGMSTGAVFASFADKAELFDEIIACHFRDVRAQMVAALDGAGDMHTALVRLFEAAYRAQTPQLPLVRAAISSAWTRDPGTADQAEESMKPILNLLRDTLRQGVERGELASDTDVRLLRAIVWEIYLSGYRGAVYQGWGVDELTRRFSQQLQIILAGVKA
ncbi:MAG TPA: TetR/AcrR family transcriptional regulator [Caulobacteraceae bacterium]